MRAESSQEMEKFFEYPHSLNIEFTLGEFIDSKKLLISQGQHLRLFSVIAASLIDRSLTNPFAKGANRNIVEYFLKYPALDESLSLEEALKSIESFPDFF